METTRTCKRCYDTKQNTDFYPNRRICKKCIIKLIQTNHSKNYDITIDQIKCKKCNDTFAKEFFLISNKTGLRKTTCFNCREYKTNSSIELAKMTEMRNWINSFNINPEDLKLFKKVINAL